MEVKVNFYLMNTDSSNSKCQTYFINPFILTEDNDSDRVKLRLFERVSSIVKLVPGTTDDL